MSPPGLSTLPPFLPIADIMQEAEEQMPDDLPDCRSDMIDILGAAKAAEEAAKAEGHIRIIYKAL